jgi:recombination protein RecT
VRHALHEISLDGKLQECTPASIYLSLLACACTGLVPGKMRGLSFLIPFRNTKKVVDDKGHGKEIVLSESTFMIGWRGVKLTGFRAGIDMVSDVVYSQDEFDFDKGTDKFLRHKPALRARGEVIGAYAYAQLPRGGLEIEWLGVEELGKIELAASAKGASPAWNGPFKSQMQRKSALRRLGKQLEMGEDFHRAELMENGQADTGSIASALDIITEGEATRGLTAASTESAVFGATPRPTQVQVPVQVVEGPPPAAKNAAAGNQGSKARPTAPASAAPPSSAPSPQQSQSTGSTSSSPPSSGSSKLDDAKAKVEAKRETPTAAPATSSGSPATAPAGGNAPARSGSPTSAGGSPNQAAPASPASSSPASPPTSTESEFLSSTEPSSGAEFDDDMSSEPGADDDFDVSFSADDEPVTPTTREGWIAAFRKWVSEHPDKADVRADPSWKELFRGWAMSCVTRAEMDADKSSFVGWAQSVFDTGAKGDPAKGIAARPPEAALKDVRDIFAGRYKELPA